MRYNYLDFARGILMSLGIVIHSAQAFSPVDWRVDNPDSSAVFDYLIDFVHSFRMPSFFIIAGFFAAMLLSRCPPGEYLGTRYVRLGVPLLFCGLTINSLIHWLSHENYRIGLAAFSSGYWLGGVWLDHLWFLVNLLVYITLFAGCIKLFPNLLGWVKAVGFKLWHLYVLTPVVIFLLRRVAWLVPEPPMGNTWFFVSVGPLLEYGPFFLLGAIFYLKQNLFLDFVQRRLLGAGFIAAFMALYMVGTPAMHDTYVYEIMASLSLLGFIALLFSFFKHYFNGNSKAIRNISDSSYTIYLVHPPIILATVLALSNIDFNIYAKFLFIVVFTWCVSYCFHFWVVDKISPLRFLMNGKRSKGGLG